MKIKWLRAAARFAAAVFVLLAVSFTVGCPINRLTGLKCPGCGVTRMVLKSRCSILKIILVTPQPGHLRPVSRFMGQPTVKPVSYTHLVPTFLHLVDGGPIRVLLRSN